MQQSVRNPIIFVIALTSILVVAYSTLQRQPKEADQEAVKLVAEEEIEDTELEPPSATQPRILTIELQSLNNSEEFGTAVFRGEGDTVRVDISLNGVPNLLYQPAHIHSGTCGDLGRIRHPLADVFGARAGFGSSESFLDTSLSELLSDLPWAVNVHLSEQQMGISVACGSIDASSPIERIQLKVGNPKLGDGLTAEKGDVVSVHYVGTLQDGSKFDSSRERGEPFTFQLGAGQVIRGWDIGLEGMKVGGIRKLTIPSELAYGERGLGNLIAPGATLVFHIELLAVQGKE